MINIFTIKLKIAMIKLLTVKIELENFIILISRGEIVKKKHIVLVVVGLLLLLGVALFIYFNLNNNSGITERDKKELAKFEGDWNVVTEKYSYLVGYFEENGKFSIYDAEAGNPCMSGKFEINYKNKEIELSCDKVEFDPPWEMDYIQTFKYEIDDNNLKLIDGDNYLEFVKDKN